MSSEAIRTPSLARSNSTVSTSSSVYSEVSEPSSLDTSFSDQTTVDEQTKARQKIIIATSDYYDYALKLERLSHERDQVKRDKHALKRQEKQARYGNQMRLIDIGPENSRLIGHTQETLDSKLRFTEDEIRRIKMHMRKIRVEFPAVMTANNVAGPDSFKLKT